MKARGDYSSIASFKKKNRYLGGDIPNFARYFKIFTYLLCDSRGTPNGVLRNTG